MSPRGLAIGACPHVCSLLSYSRPLLRCHSVFVHLRTVYLSLLSPLCVTLSLPQCVYHVICHPFVSPCHYHSVCTMSYVTPLSPCHYHNVCTMSYVTPLLSPCHCHPVHRTQAFGGGISNYEECKGLSNKRVQVRLSAVCVRACVCVCVRVCVYMFQVLCLVHRLIQVLLQKIGVEIELGFIMALSRLLTDRKKHSTKVPT